MVKHYFSILTRNGQKIDNLAIMARDRDDAERKLRQMYRQCDVLRCDLQPLSKENFRVTPTDQVLTLVGK